MELLKIDEIDKNEISDESGFALESFSSDADEADSVESEFDKPFKPRDIKIDVKPIPIERIINRFNRNQIILHPDFQRNSVWDIKRKCRLIESLMLNIPLPIFYVSADENGVWSVVDGQPSSRLISAKSAFSAATRKNRTTCVTSSRPSAPRRPTRSSSTSATCATWLASRTRCTGWTTFSTRRP